MKIWCETCDGTGIGGVNYEKTNDWFKCKDCNGKGYTENETIEHEARVGRAAIKLLKNEGVMQVEDMLDESDCESVYTCEITNVKSLLQWAEETE